MADTQATFIATLIDEWFRGGVRHAVVCPGNRSTLLSALLVEDGRFRVHVMTDERSASFFALGIGKATGTPAVFWCTSGTAAVEAHAAVVEAHHSNVPLIVATSDRPPELHHVRDWQSIDQARLFGDAPRWAFDPGVATDGMRATWRSIAARSVIETQHHPSGPGPVHLNLPIREPWNAHVGDLPPAREGGWHSTLAPEAAVSLDALSPWFTKRGIIVAGEGSPDAEVLHAAAAALGWPVMAEARSGCRTPHSTTISLFDEVVRVPSFAGANQPEVVFRFGTPSISKPLASWLEASAAFDIAVDQYGQWSGARRDTNITVVAEPHAVCRAIAASAQPVGNEWLDAWQQAQATATSALAPQLNNGFTEPAAAHALASSVRCLFAATSMPIRDVESYAPPRDDLAVYANRGASGMDGIISTALGVAIGSEQPVTLLTGDLTFLYDLNALWLRHGIDGSLDVTVVVIDNNGGGIFSLLPQLDGISPEVFERVVSTPQSVDIPAVVRAFGIPVEEVTSLEQLRASVARSAGFRMLYVKSERQRNAEVHAAIHAAVARVAKRRAGRSVR